MGDPLSCTPVQPDPAFAVLPVNAYSLAVACGGRGVSLDIGPASLSAPRSPALPRSGARRRIAPPSRTRPRATACRSLHARPVVRPARLSRTAAQRPPRMRPLSRATATWRSVPLRRVDRMLPRDCGEAHGHPSVPPRTPDAPSGNATQGGQWLRRTIAPRHYSRTRRMFSRTLAAAGLEADLAACHYPFSRAANRLPALRPGRPATLGRVVTGGRRSARTTARGLSEPATRPRPTPQTPHP